MPAMLENFGDEPDPEQGQGEDGADPPSPFDGRFQLAIPDVGCRVVIEGHEGQAVLGFKTLNAGQENRPPSARWLECSPSGAHGKVASRRTPVAVEDSPYGKSLRAPSQAGVDRAPQGPRAGGVLGAPPESPWRGGVLPKTIRLIKDSRSTEDSVMVIWAPDRR